MLCNLFGSEHCSEIVCDINMVEFKAEHLLSVRWSASGERDPYFCSKTVIWLYDLKKKKISIIDNSNLLHHKDIIVHARNHFLSLLSDLDC